MMNTQKCYLCAIILIIILQHPLFAQSTQYPLKEDVSTIDGIMKATYEAVSGEAGEKRQWERDLSLHHPKAVYAFPDMKNGKPIWTTMTLSEFHKTTDDMVAKTAFYEREVTREVRLFGKIAHVWSTYETRLSKNGPVKRRGINSVQLFYNQGRWWIISWTFDRETKANPIPKTFDRN